MFKNSQLKISNNISLSFHLHSHDNINPYSHILCDITSTLILCETGPSP